MRIATDSNPEERRPGGLYGNRFAAASIDAIERATKPILPPTLTNLIAIAAPQGGKGTYQMDDIQHILVTAYTGFAAARLESQQMSGEGTKVAVHTGFWGCGAFGGNRVLMAMLQMLAAHLAAIDVLVFHTFDSGGMKAFAEAKSTFSREIIHAGGADPTQPRPKRKGILASVLSRKPEVDKPTTVGDLLKRIAAMGFEWGVSDGN